MTSVPASAVKELREMTGAGMMDCKRALVETGGDVEAAVKVIRERGLAQAAKRAGRETTEGKVVYDISEETVAAMVAVGCETEPVANNAEFMVFAQRVLDAVERGGPGAEQELEEERLQLIGKLGENIVVRGVARFEAEEGDILTAYVHPPANKLGVLVHARGTPDVAKELAMHIAWSAPAYTRRSEVPEAEVNAEREILARQPDVQGKPEHVRDKIVEGRIQKWFQAQVLEEQEWIHDTSRRVGDVLREAGLEIVQFRRLAVAE
ncbi:MAG TPA: translation elongation factor Ts [Gaiellaceae bacterium]|nr:translation elongation factor Ts [Gaiellaceae bacterium]